LSLRIGIDTGGTFTDVVVFDAGSGQLSFHKVNSTPRSPATAIVQGTAQGVDAAGAAAADIELLVHGTTVATNSVLQRAGARVAIITTSGFRDVLHIQRQDRPRLYDMRCRRPAALIPRHLRFELSERTLFDGTVETPIAAAELDRIIEQLEVEQVEAVLVGFLHSYVNPGHEIEVGRVLTGRLPEVTVCLSHELVGEHGEYERFSTGAMNAYVQPVVRRYLTRLDDELASAGITAPLFVMKSNGGVMSADRAGRQCVETILSGPAGGVVAGAAIAAHNDNCNLITADMGGTSFDVAVIRDAAASFARDTEIGGLVIAVPMLDIHTVGAGGGSIAWIDAGGLLRVGPRSAGADPGSACYGRGGQEPTVTDANLVLGRLAPDSLLDGSMILDMERAERAIYNTVAGPLGMAVEAAAEGIVRVVNTIMTAAIRRLTVERGLDPRDFSLCAFGGAGPLHGAELAAELGVRETVIPIAPGVHSALGLLMSNLREDRIRTCVQPFDDVDMNELEDVFSDMAEDAANCLRDASTEGDRFRVTRALGMRYLGQRYELPVPIADGSLVRDVIANDFHTEHLKMYGFERRDQAPELASVWVSVEVGLRSAQLPEVAVSHEPPAPVATRRVVFAGSGHETPVCRRGEFGAGATLTGPAIIEQLDSTTVLWPGQTLAVDRFGHLILGRLEKE